jgi:hypothetical protein
MLPKIFLGCDLAENLLQKQKGPTEVGPLRTSAHAYGTPKSIKKPPKSEQSRKSPLYFGRINVSWSAQIVGGNYA